MALTRKYQNNFTAGVISPAAYARTDLAKYASGCKRIVNGIIHAHGGISNRPGTVLVDELPGPGLLIPFAYSVEQTYVLAFFDPDPESTEARFAKMRIYKEGGVVVDPGSDTVAEITTPYLPGDLQKIKFVQSADTMFLAHPAHPPMKLVRTAHHQWTFSAIEFYPNIAPPANLTATASGFNDSSHTYVATECTYKVAAVSARMVESMPSEPATARTLSTWPSGAKVVLAWDSVEGADHYEVYKNDRGYYAYLGSAEKCTFTDNNIQGDSGTGPKENRDPFNPPPTPTGVTLTGTAGTKKLLVRVAAVNSAGTESVASATAEALVVKASATVGWEPAERAESYLVYFKYESDPVWQYVSAPAPEEGSDGSCTLDDPQKYQDGTPLDKPNCYPGAVGIYQQRLIFGRTDLEPHTVWLSETGAFDSMAVANPLRDDSAIVATVDSREMNEIRHFVPLREVLMLTGGAEFQLSAGKNSDAVTPTTITFNPQSYWGASDVPPIVSGINALFVENSGRVVRDVKYQLTDDGYTGEEVSILAEHLIDSPIADWAYQQDPWSTIYICLASGKLLTFTYMREQEIWAWSEHESSGGKFLSVSSIREGDKDNTYFLVERFNRYFVEYQKRREYGDPIERSFYVDCGLEYDDPDHPIAHVTGLDHLAGKEVVALADGSVVRRLTVASDGSVDLPERAGRIVVGLAYRTLVETLDPEIKTQEGAAFGMKRNIPSVTLFLRESRGLKVGPSESQMVEAKFPPPEEWGRAPGLFSGELNVAVMGHHRDEATIVITQEDPLPLTLLGVGVVVSVG